MTKPLIDRIDEFLSRQSQPEKAPANESLVTDDSTLTEKQLADVVGLRSSLSGAFNEAINIYVGTDADAGTYLAEVPMKHLKACGIRMVESIVRPRCGSRDVFQGGSQIQIVIGSQEALANAERRVAKPLGEAWKVTADSYPIHVGAPEAMYFRVSKA